MLRKIVMGLVWFVVFYFGTCFIVGGIAGGIAGSRDPAHAQEAGGIAGREAVLEYRPFILGGSILFAFAGSMTGILPGTKPKPKPKS